MRPNFTPMMADVKDAYYEVGDGPPDQVFSTARAAYVPVTDSVYVAWSGAFRTRKIDTEGLLWDVLAQQAPACLPSDIPEALAVKDAVAFSLLSDAAKRFLFDHENRLRLLENQGVVEPGDLQNVFMDSSASFDAAVVSAKPKAGR